LKEFRPSPLQPKTAAPETAEPPSVRSAYQEYFLPFQRLPIAIHSMNPDGLLQDVNEAWVAFTGYTRARAVGSSFADFLDPPSASLYRDKAVPELINTVPSRESRSVEYRLIKASGEIADIVLTSRPERDPESGEFLHSLTVMNDITARHRAEAALRQGQKLEALGSLTGGVAHDFNNLLAVILGSLELLGRRLPAEDTRSARLVDVALRGAKRGEALTARLLAFARRQDLAPRPVDPRKLLASLRPVLGQLLGPSVTIEESLVGSLWNLRADPHQLELALLNLAANARDAMPEGGRLHLAARNATVAPAAPSVFIDHRTRAAIPAGDHVVLSLCDTGTGMDEAALARAADPFFTTKGPGKGTGLGLSMVHGFAVQSGGALLLSSQPGAGTTAELWLPRAVEPSSDADECDAVHDPAPQRSAESLRILLVDDDPLVAVATVAMLDALGHDMVHAVESGEAALSVLRQGDEFDLLLTDYMMPGMSGGQLAAEARALDPSLPILLASGFAELDGLIGTEWPRLRKPYSLGHLSAALAAFRRRPRG